MVVDRLLLRRQGRPARGRGAWCAIVRIALRRSDHIGSLDELAAALPGAEVLTARDAAAVHKDMPLQRSAAARQLPEDVAESRR